MSTRGAQLGSRKERERTHLRVVRRNSRGLIKRSRSRRLAPLAIAGIIAGIALVFGILLEQIVLAQSAFRLSEIREGLAAAESQYEELMHEAASLDNPARIERFAKSRLGMVEPSPGAQKFVVADVKFQNRIQRTVAIRERALPPESGGAAAGVP